MSGLDIVIVVAVIAAAVGGYQLGFLARVLSWAGLAVSLLVLTFSAPRLLAQGGGAGLERRMEIDALRRT